MMVKRRVQWWREWRMTRSVKDLPSVMPMTTPTLKGVIQAMSTRLNGGSTNQKPIQMASQRQQTDLLTRLPYQSRSRRVPPR